MVIRVWRSCQTRNVVAAPELRLTGDELLASPSVAQLVSSSPRVNYMSPRNLARRNAQRVNESVIAASSTNDDTFSMVNQRKSAVSTSLVDSCPETLSHLAANSWTS